MSTRRKFIDQARDPLAGFFQPTAETYDAYLEGEYRLNAEEQSDAWSHHYRKMRSAFVDFLVHTSEDKGLKRKDMNLAIVGPGLEPVGRDFDEHIVEVYLSQLRSVILIDFSTKAVRSAMDSLIRAGVPAYKLHGVQYDITNGLSTVYEGHIREKFGGTEVDEGALENTTRQLESFSIADLDYRLDSELTSRDSLLTHDPDFNLGGGINTERTLKFTVGGEPLPLHMVTLQMVSAGTGAAAENIIKDRYIEATSEVDSGARESCPGTQERRRIILENIYKMIATYNTAITKRFLEYLLECNPEASVLNIVDVSTFLEEPRFGEMPRLHIPMLKEQLNKANIVTTIPSSGWEWRDELPQHFHGVKPIESELRPSQNGNGSGKDGAEDGPQEHQPESITDASGNANSSAPKPDEDENHTPTESYFG